MKQVKWVSVVLVLVMLGSITSPVMAAKTRLPTHPPKLEIEIPEPSPPLNESELTHIVFPVTWLLSNDQDKRDNVVKISFPERWIENPPKVGEGVPVALLRMPKDLLKTLDLSDDPDTITVALPIDEFEFYSDVLNIKNRRLGNDVQFPSISSGTTPRITSYSNTNQERVFYACEPFSENPTHVVTGAMGVIDPSYYSNSGQDITIYHESELYLDSQGDVIELISGFYSDNTVRVWAALYDKNDYKGSLVSIEVTGTLQPVKYYVTIENGIYRVYLKDTNSGQWYKGSYNDADDPGTRITWFVASNEVYYNTITKTFRAGTYPISTTYVNDKNSLVRPNEVLSYWDRTSNEPYVYVDAYFGDQGELIMEYHSANDEP